MSAALGGTWFVLPTPFHPDGSLDLDSQARLVDAAVSWGVDGLTALGVTSEAGELAPDERDAALDAVAGAAAGRVPLVVGCSASSADRAAELIRRAHRAGAVGAMVSAPPGTPDPRAVPAFFKAVSRAGLPIVIQDEPAATGIRLDVPTLLRCVSAASARTVKLEDPPTAPKIAALLAEDPDLRIFGGLGGIAALSELRRGACGTMTGFAFPEILRAIRERLAAGDPEAASRIFDRYLPLIQFEGQPGVGLAVRKELLHRRGAISSPTTRRGMAIDPVILEELDDVLSRVGLRPAPGPVELRGGEV